jgi:hypothetical protein
MPIKTANTSSAPYSCVCFFGTGLINVLISRRIKERFDHDVLKQCLPKMSVGNIDLTL